MASQERPVPPGIILAGTRCYRAPLDAGRVAGAGLVSLLGPASRATSDRVSEINVATSTVVSRVRVGGAIEAAVDPTRHTAYVTSDPPTART
jgi:hypothetical protein